MKSIRDIWSHEAHDFTPWLANNLHLLGDALGMSLERDRTEAQVGPYFLDILAKETERGVTVAIENQLEWTDFEHLAQILIYSAGCDARIAIWVAPEFRYESAEVLNWLNEWTRDGLDFYGVRFDVGGSADETTFQKVVYPGGWNKEITKCPGQVSPEGQRYRDFFQPLVDELRERGLTDRTRAYAQYYQRFPPSHFRGIEYGACFYYRPDVACVYVSIDTEDKGLNKQVFDALKERKGEIQTGIDGELEWRRNDGYRFSEVGIRRDGSIDDAEKWAEIRAWMLEYLPKLKEVLDPHLERVLKELQPEGTDGT